MIKRETMNLRLRREWCWSYGVAHRESLLHAYMTERGITKRPFLSDVVDALIEEVQGARLVEGILPLDRFAQTESRSGRPLVTINTRIAQIPGVKDVDGVAYAAKWHESIHIPRDIACTAQPAPWQTPHHREAAEPAAPLVVCRATTRGGTAEERDREFIAETAGLAAAIAGADLARCVQFRDFQARFATGGDTGWVGWTLLRDVAAFLGVNRTALCTYLGQRGFITIVRKGDRQQLIAAPQGIQQSGGIVWRSLD